MSKKIAVIIGSSRPTRVGDKVGTWFVEKVKNTDGLTFEIIDLQKVNLPMFDEPIPPMMGQYTNAHTKEWATTISGFDGYIFVTPEYNHGYPAVLKNAIDYLYAEWVGKPVAFVSYGAHGGVRAVEQLRQVVVNVGLNQVNTQVTINSPWSMVKEDGSIDEQYVNGDPMKLIEELQTKF